jgi:hypothetical protein
MELLAAALSANQRHDFEDVMQKIRNQPQI